MAGETPNKKDFFISYTGADQPWAEWIAWQLEDEGYSVTLQAWHFKPGNNFAHEMQTALEQCEKTLAVVSDRYLHSKFAMSEFYAAFVDDPLGEAGKVIPVRIEEFEAKGLIKPIVYVDLFEKDPSEARTVLLQGVSGEDRKPTTAPAFPGSSGIPAADAPTFPGGLPRAWNVPPRNPNFTGREDMLDTLKSNLDPGKMTALTPQAIRGLGGVGKTQLAREFAHRYKAEYDVVWWVSSELEAELREGYAALAKEVVPGATEINEVPPLVAAAKEWLERSDGWLLIFDNVENPKAIADYLPSAGNGHVIITSRHGAWRGVAEPLEVTVMEPGEAVDFLTARSGVDDREEAAKLADTLGYLPLALAQAAAYIESAGQTFQGYLDLFETRHRDLWENEDPPEGYPDTVGTTWDISIEKMAETEPGALELLNLCAFFAPEEITKSFLTRTETDLPGALNEVLRDPLRFDRCLTAVNAFSLADITPSGIKLHRLVQVVIRGRLDDEDRNRCASAALALLNAAIPGDLQTNVGAWPAIAVLVPHGLAAVDIDGAAEASPEDAGMVLSAIGNFFHVRADLNQARRCLERALRIAEAAFGKDHFNVAACVNNLGSVLEAQGDLDGAKDCFERALRIDEAAYGKDHPEVATDVNNLGSVLKAQGDLAGAKSCFERSLRIDEEAFGKDHPKVAIRVNNLGLVLQAQGDFDGAKSCFERALGIDEATFSKDHPEVATVVNNLGSVLQDQGDLDGAKDCYERALDIFEKFLRPEHPNSRGVRKNLEIVQQLIDARAGGNR